MASLLLLPPSQIVPAALSGAFAACGLRSSRYASPFPLFSPLRIGSVPHTRAPLTLPNRTFAIQASSPSGQPADDHSSSEGNDRTTRIRSANNSRTPGPCHTPLTSVPPIPRPLALTSVASISIALALSAFPSLAADVSLLEPPAQVTSALEAPHVQYSDKSSVPRHFSIASASLSAPPLETLVELAPASVIVTPSESGSDSLESGPIMQLAASGEAASHGVVKTCANLLAACALLVWFQRIGSLPPSTPIVLAQVSNLMLIPCFLAVHVASAVSAAPESILASLPLIASAQLLFAAAAGHLARSHARRSSSSSSSLLSTPSLLPRPPVLSPRPSTALHQLAAAITASLSSPQPAAEPSAEAAAVPAAEPAQSHQQEAWGKPADVGGKAVMLLLLLAMTVVSETHGDGLAGQLALLFVGWAPALCLLACGTLLETSQAQLPGLLQLTRASGSPSAPLLSTRFFSPPVMGVLAGLVIGATPLSQLLLLPGGTHGLATTDSLLVDSGSLLALLQWHADEMAGCMHGVMEAASFLGAAALPLHLMALVSSLASFDSSQQQQQQQQLQQQAILAPIKPTSSNDAASPPDLSL